MSMREEELRDHYARLDREKQALRSMDPSQRRRDRIAEIETVQASVRHMLLTAGSLAPRKSPDRSDLFAAVTMAKCVTEQLERVRGLQQARRHFGAYEELISATRLTTELTNKLHSWTEGDAL